jgi:hypothetical protein
MVIGIDLTVTPIDNSAICSGVMAYVNRGGDDGMLIIAIAITARTLTQPIILAQESLPVYRGIKEKNRKLAIETFNQKLATSLGKQSNYPKEFFKQTRIDEFFQLAGNIFDEHHITSQNRRMVLFSDMLQVDERCNWEKGREISAQHLQIHPVGGSVAIYGVQSPLYSNSEKWEKVRTAWIELLKQAKVNVLTYVSTYPQ